MIDKRLHGHGELEKLAKRRDEGVISSDDFEAKKKQLLGA